MLEDLFGLFIIGYIVVSVILSIVKRAQHQASHRSRDEEWVRPPTDEPPVITVQSMLDEKVPARVREDASVEDIHRSTSRPTQSDVRQSALDTFDHIMWDEADDAFPADIPSSSVNGQRDGRPGAVGGHTGPSASMKQSLRAATQSKQSIRQAIVLSEVLGPPRAKRRHHRMQ